MKRFAAAVLVGAVLAAALGTSTSFAAPRAPHPPVELRPSSPPVLAYSYIWFDHRSWSRAKTDRPKLGPYSSDDAAVMRQQIEWAKRAGIGGFLVSWKHTTTLDRRLTQLVDIAESEHFALGIVYQGLDFHRNPQPASRVATDLDYFAATFAGRTPFTAFGRPLVIWSGTWRFTPAEVAGVTAGRRGQLAILASERNVDGYRRLAGSVDGDAYYWSSVNPSTYHGYVEKLSDLGREVHAGGGRWIAPAAPGFDARGVGGTSTVTRAGDRTLLREIDAALASSPDALGLISWNEFSENSHVEPSVRYGWTALNAVGERLGRGPVAAIGDHGTGHAVRAGASGATGARRPAGRDAAVAHSSRVGLWIIIGFALLFVVLVGLMARRARRAPPLRAVATPDDVRRDRRRRSRGSTRLSTNGMTASDTGHRAPPTTGSRRRRRRRTPLYRLVLDELSDGRGSRPRSSP